jgi:N-acetylneuraminic acid mutarotase
VLVVGGRAGAASLSSCEVFDPDTGDWNDEGDLNEARTGHSAVLLYTGNVLVVGGIRPEGSCKALNSLIRKRPGGPWGPL